MSKDVFEPAVNVSGVETFETCVEGRVSVPVLLLVLIVVARQGSETVHDFTDVRDEKQELKMSNDDVLKSNFSNGTIDEEGIFSLSCRTDPTGSLVAKTGLTFLHVSK